MYCMRWTKVIIPLLFVLIYRIMPVTFFFGCKFQLFMSAVRNLLKQIVVRVSVQWGKVMTAITIYSHFPTEINVQSLPKVVSPLWYVAKLWWKCLLSWMKHVIDSSSHLQDKLKTHSHDNTHFPQNSSAHNFRQRLYRTCNKRRKFSQRRPVEKATNKEASLVWESGNTTATSCPLNIVADVSG